MSTLDAYALEYEDRPFQKPERVGRISTKMSKSNQPTSEAPVYNKTKGEHRKDLVIAILVSGIITFIGGMTFQGNQQQAIETAVKGAQVAAPVETPVKK